MKKKLLIFILVLVMTLIFVPGIASAANTTEFAGGSGTEKDPYLISTKEQLNNVRKYLDAHFKLTCDIVFTNADFAKGGTFYNRGTGWEPIGTKEAPFTGSFDGNGFAVKNLYVNKSGSSKIYVGLFGYTYGTIRNLGIVGGKVSATAFSSIYYSVTAYVGGIAGYNSYGTIENCYNAGNVLAMVDGDNGYAYVGGIAGMSEGIVTNCYNTGDISATAEDATTGGIAGRNYDDGIITGCYSTGKISATGEDCEVGGIVGCNNNTITVCYNTGNISSTADYYADVGGIAGYNYGEITRCCNTGAVSAKAKAKNKEAHAGGITGCNHDGAITNCYNTGKVSATVSSSSSVAYAGGIAGKTLVGTITNCYNTSKVSATVSSSSSTVYAGGITGYNDGTIANCYNTGDISVPASSYVGGIAGTNAYACTITNCYYLNTISVGVGAGTDTAKKCTAKQMQTKSTFVGFNFTNTWDINANIAYKYPLLDSINPYKTATVKLSTTSYTYNGKVKTPAVTVKNAVGKTLTKNVDYTVTYDSGRINVGTYKVTIKGKGKYYFTKTLTFKINPIKASNCSMKLSTYTYTYNGKVKTPTVKIVSPTGSTLTKGTSYTVSYESGRVNVGTYTVKVTMKGNYTGTKTQTFKINPIKAANCAMKLSTYTYTYNGKVKEPSVTIVSPTGSTLTKGTSYTVTYSGGRINVGTYTVKVTMKGNYTGTKTQTFKINPIKASNCAMKLSTYTYTYNGKVKEPSVTIVSPTGSTLTKGTSYTVSYESGRVNVGTYTVKVTMKGNYTGTKTQTFKINPIKASNCAMKLSATSYTYDGKVKAPSVKIVSPTGSTLTKGTSYTVSYESGRVNAGTYTVKVTMKGNYTGTRTLTFKINPAKTTVS